MEAVWAVAGLAVLSCLASLASIRKVTVDEHLGGPLEHRVTVWRVLAPAGDATELVPRKITVEYEVSLSADSEEDLAALQAAHARDANADFARRFAPYLGDGAAGAGAVRIELDEEEESE